MRLFKLALGTLGTLGCNFLGAASTSVSNSTECEAVTPGGPVLITADCIDPLYSPVIDSDTNQTSPFPHRRVSGHFNGTSLDFNIYLPPKSQWQGRFFDYVYPTTPNDTAPDWRIAFALDSGAYLIAVTGTEGYRADSAAAKFSRTIAAEYYGTGSEHIYGYIAGGSGGSFMVVGAIENTIGVWDGGVPYIQAVPISVPNNLCASAFGTLVLAGKSSQIINAVSPGGSGNPYASLNDVESSVFRELTLFGIPLDAWEMFTSMADLVSTLIEVTPGVISLDPSYKDEFWTEPGYLGTEQSELGDIIRSALVNSTATIVQVVRGANDTPVEILLDNVPNITTTNGLEFTMYNKSETAEIGPLLGTLDLTKQAVILDPGNNATILEAISEGLEVHIDNAWFIALHPYHRYQIPPASDGYYGYDQYRNAAGAPIYPQRPVLVAPLLAEQTSGGGTNTGSINSKIIVVCNLVDYDAMPWHADWYKTRVQNALGSTFEDNYRLWYNEHADHYAQSPNGSDAAIVVDYTGIVEQALRDVVSWVEDGEAPAPSTSYSVAESQVSIPKNASERGGIQPSVLLNVSVADSNVTVGQTVKFEADIDVPIGTGQIVDIEWDFLGTGEYSNGALEYPSENFKVNAEYTYSTAGVYLPGVRVTSQRQGNITTPFGRIENLGRTRVNVA